MKKHPFKEDTKLAKTFTILADGEWHCGKHELPGTQPAKAIQIIRQHGFKIENSTRLCSICKEETVHRRLVSTEPIKPSTEAITLREMISKQLEVDHRFPQVRWSKDEVYDVNMTERELHRKFQLLTRQHNLWKSRYCEHCKKTGERGTFIGINFFAEGRPKWDLKISDDDESGCYGCFWYDPDKWRKALNKLVKRAEERGRN